MKANHNIVYSVNEVVPAVLATTKVPNLKANHNYLSIRPLKMTAVLATTKVPNLKANHNHPLADSRLGDAVLATAKVPNLKANHNVTAKYSERGYTKTRTHAYVRSDGSQGTNSITVWTEQGRLFLHDLLTAKA